MYNHYMPEKTSTVNISFRQDLLNQIDEVARTESRSRSELVREAARMYIERKRRMDSVIESIQETIRQRGITEEDVVAEVAAVRAERAQRTS
jgi:metal-responsive CopG/Arc/MetJ family transcriptional regulator